MVRAVEEIVLQIAQELQELGNKAQHLARIVLQFVLVDANTVAQVQVIAILVDKLVH